MKKKIVSIVLVIFMILFGYNQVFAANTVSDTGKDWLNLGENEVPKAKGLASMLDRAFGVTNNCCSNCWGNTRNKVNVHTG